MPKPARLIFKKGFKGVGGGLLLGGSSKGLIAYVLGELHNTRTISFVSSMSRNTLACMINEFFF